MKKGSRLLLKTEKINKRAKALYFLEKWFNKTYDKPEAIVASVKDGLIWLTFPKIREFDMAMFKSNGLELRCVEPHSIYKDKLHIELKLVKIIEKEGA